MFASFDLNLHLIADPIPNLKFRDRSVLILLRDENGKFILEGEGGWYPERIARMLGGGVEKGEEVIDAAIREMKEETGLDIPSKDLIELIQVHLTGDYQDKTYTSQVFVYLYDISQFILEKGHDASNVVTYSESEYRDLVQRFFDLKDDNLHVENSYTFSWGDYGRIYGFVHKTALDELLKRGL